jgi:hypothetical protein
MDRSLRVRGDTESFLTINFPGANGAIFLFTHEQQILIYYFGFYKKILSLCQAVLWTLFNAFLLYPRIPSASTAPSPAIA